MNQNKDDIEYSQFMKNMGFKLKKDKKTINLNRVLIAILLLSTIVLVCLSCYKKVIEIQQARYDLLYKETVNSSVDDDCMYVYRRINRETGEVDVVISGYRNSDKEWVQGIVEGEFEE